MKLTDNLHLALRMFKTRPMRTSLTILGVSVGIGTVLFLVSLGYGLQQAILNRIANADTLLTLDVTAGSNAVQLTDAAIADMAKIDHVKETSRLANFRGQISSGNINTDAVMVAMDPSFFRLGGQAAAEGTLFTDESPADSAVLSTAVVQLLGTTPEEVIGKRLSIYANVPQYNADGTDATTVAALSGSVTVTGIIENSDASELYMPLAAFKDTRVTRYDRLKVKVDKNDFLEQTRNTVIDRGYVVSSLSDIIDQANTIFGIIQLVLGFFGFIALLVSAIGMFNTMTITLLERTNEIGIMRSIGITKRDIRNMFLVESMLMGFLGGVTGLLLSTIGGTLLNFGLNILASRYHAPAMDIFVTPLWFALTVIAFSSVIGFLTGVYPSYRASKLNPLDALRYK